MTLRPLRKAAAILGSWTLVAVLFAPQNYFANRALEDPMPAWLAILVGSSLFFVWAALTPLVIWLAERFPFRRDRLVRTIALH
ncbi:MAG TPA: hypothetical protein VEU30_08890, partial [Thermoanaerobaculia bacterium]|nr:hypothetical protein [Thermoanaerobaculia bacterium]